MEGENVANLSGSSTEEEDDDESSSDSNGSSTEGENDGDIESASDLREQLMRASADGSLSKVKYLMGLWHVDPHLCRDGENDNTPLHLASNFGHLDIVRYLVEERNCDVVCRNKHGNTPLHYATLGGRLDVVQYLISERG